MRCSSRTISSVWNFSDRPRTFPAYTRIGSITSCRPRLVTAAMSRARGPSATTDRPCAPSACHGSSDHGLPDRSGSHGCIRPGITRMFTRCALRYTRSMVRRTSNLSTARPSPPPTTIPAVTGATPRGTHGRSTRRSRSNANSAANVSPCVARYAPDAIAVPPNCARADDSASMPTSAPTVCWCWIDRHHTHAVAAVMDPCHDSAMRRSVRTDGANRPNFVRRRRASANRKP